MVKDIQKIKDDFVIEFRKTLDSLCKSVTTDDMQCKENGVFYQLGEEVFDDYWKNYDSISFKDPEGKEKNITNIWDYLAYRNRKKDFKKVGEGARKKPKYYNDKNKI